MSQTLFSTVSIKTSDEAGNISTETDFKHSAVYTQKFCGDIQQASDNTYETLSFGSISSSLAFRFNTDQPLSMKLNGNSNVLVLSGTFYFDGVLSSVQILNNSGYVANIEYEVYA